MELKKEVEPAEVAYLADRAVNELIEDAQSGRLRQNRELAETLIVCLCKIDPQHLQTLKWLLDQRALERPDLQHKHPDYKDRY